jgi:hypothetical protein
MIRFALAASLMFVSFSFAAAAPATKPIGADRAINGGFEGDGGMSFLSTNGANATGGITKEQAHSGTHSYKLTNKTGFAPNVYARAFQIVTGLEPFTTYRISCWVKGTKSGICWIGGGPGWFNRNQFPKGTFDWTKV